MESKKMEQFLLEATNPDWVDYYFPKGKFRGQIVYEYAIAHGVEYDRVLWINYIESLEPGNGNTQEAIKKLLREHYDVRIVLPNDTMKHIAKKFGLIKKYGQTSLPFPDRREYYALPTECVAGFETPCDADCAWCNHNRECKFKLFFEEYAYVI